MVDDAPNTAAAAEDTSAAPQPAPIRQRRIGRLRAPINRWEALLLGLLCIAVALGIWWFLTRGESAEDRIVSPTRLPSVAETFDSFKSLWFERALTRNTLASLRRVVLGFGLAALVGVPAGILCGCFTRLAAFLAPLTIFGRNIPMAALIPLSFSLFGIDEWQKIMFIFIAAVAFIVSDAAQAIRDVDGRYIDTAYTLGASRRQTILKVLVPLAMPNIFNSLRLLFGLAFGYIMLAEVIQVGGVSGLGGIINNSFRRGPKEHIYLVLLIIPLIALAIDRTLFWIQKQLFPFRYGGPGWLARGTRGLMHWWEGVKGLFFEPTDISSLTSGMAAGPAGAAVVAEPAAVAPDASQRDSSGNVDQETV
ncbi:MAG: ABC transporter permease [Planctomycetota bacterium]|nr:ABC transporter permease [Planctomycetota bacterium]